MSNKRNNKKKGSRTTRRRMPMWNRDALASENSLNYGDLTMVPRGFTQPALSNQVYNVVRHIESGTVSQVAGAVANPAYSFKLDDVPSKADFTGLFDQYRFRGVRIKFRPMYNMQTIASTATVVTPKLFTAIDYNGDTALTSVSDILQYQSCKETRFDQDHVRMIDPHLVMAAIGTGGMFVSNTDAKNKWLDIATTDTQHYGIKCIIQGGVGGQTILQTWTVELEYFLQFRVVR